MVVLAQFMNTEVKVTAAEPPLSNGLLKRRNLITADIMNKY